MYKINNFVASWVMISKMNNAIILRVTISKINIIKNIRFIRCINMLERLICLKCSLNIWYDSFMHRKDLVNVLTLNHRVLFSIVSRHFYGFVSIICYHDLKIYTCRTIEDVWMRQQMHCAEDISQKTSLL